MNDFYLRTVALIGESAVEKLKNSTVAVFGIGGVGSYAVEALARSGVGHLFICDSDAVEQSNINRQLIATVNSVGLNKTDIAEERCKSINPDIKITKLHTLVTPETVLPFDDFDFIIDAVDNVTAKLYLISEAKKRNIDIISIMGTGNKIFPEKLKVDDISKTHTCPLCRVMRYELKKRNIKGVNVVWSEEEPKVVGSTENRSNGRPAPASMAFVPGTAGLIAAAHTVRTLCGINK